MDCGCEVCEIHGRVTAHDFAVRRIPDDKIGEVKQRLLIHGIQCKKFSVWKEVPVCTTHHRIIRPSDDPCCGDELCHGHCPNNRRDECSTWKKVWSKLQRYFFYTEPKYGGFSTEDIRELIGWGQKPESRREREKKEIFILLKGRLFPDVLASLIVVFL
jgi:hypothetical protein